MGGVSYTVGGEAAPPTLGSATPIFCVATQSFTNCWCHLASEWLVSSTSSTWRVYWVFYVIFWLNHEKCLASVAFCPTNFFPKKLYPCWLLCYMMWPDVIWCYRPPSAACSIFITQSEKCGGGLAQDPGPYSWPPWPPVPSVGNPVSVSGPGE